MSFVNLNYSISTTPSCSTPSSFKPLPLVCIQENKYSGKTVNDESGYKLGTVDRNGNLINEYGSSLGTMDPFGDLNSNGTLKGTMYGDIVKISK